MARLAVLASGFVSEISVAMAGELPLGALGSVVHSYPTRAEAIRKAGDAWNRRRLTPRSKGILRSFLSLRHGRAEPTPSVVGRDRPPARKATP